ncbi:hypothetical protein OIDMADRAFT_143331 [Oidiodendron maius Zn]|uniref:Vacuolar import and degradation protein 21 n=1 Tax=Oidiodendron maius (strain Zn) TaxID=913774 RepID=A0A0C3CXT7_OIDMZ|nr:hypothetical protein OIDMADRAFT_143331 [Oidiodendron maius Zn]
MATAGRNFVNGIVKGRSPRSGIVTSRKRKLREFFAVCDNDGPLPQIKYENPDAPPTSAAEAHFLEVCDVLQDRFFDESNLPTRRQLRSDTSKQRFATGQVESDSEAVDTSKKGGKALSEGPRLRRSRAVTPSSKSDAGQQADDVDGDASRGSSVPRSASTGPPSGPGVEQPAVLDDIAEEPAEDRTDTQLQPGDDIPPGESERDRISRVLESRSNSPGVNPQEVQPLPVEDAESKELLHSLSQRDTHHKAATVHLPPKEVQERRLRGDDKAREERERLSVNLPRDSGRVPDLLSSPGSTIGAQSTATPAQHDISTDTSPDNGSRYDVDRPGTSDEVQTPPELKKTAEEIAAKEEHDRILKSQIELARAEILGSSPGAAEAQLRLENQAAASDQMEDTEPDTTASNNRSDIITEEAEKVVEDVIEDEKELAHMATGVEPVVGMEKSMVEAPQPNAKQREIVDSEAGTSPVEAMDIDTAPVVQDSFESNASRDTRPDVASSSQQVAAKTTLDTNVVPAMSPPKKTPSTPVAGTPTLERMTTRVSSGAMRHKSVSEILGEIPRPNTASTSERNGQKVSDSDSAGNSHSPSRSATPQSPRMRSLVEKAKEKERSKLSTVVFAKQPPKPANDSALVQNGTQSQDIKDDYFMPLFIATASSDRRGVIPPLDGLIQSARKTITTSNAYVPLNENQTSKVLKRIYNLQSAGRWSLRQPERAKEPIRPSSHWDVLLQEAKWMRTDFREERKWKIAVARNMAYACAEWVAACPEDRKLLQVKAKPPSTESTDVEMRDHPTPDLVASGEFNSPLDEFDEEPHLNLLETVPPTAIFGLQDDDVVFGLRRSPMTDKLLEELPMYGSPLKVPTEPAMTDIDPDRSWRKRALPLSKYVEGRMELKMEGPPRKRSRFEYEAEDDDDDAVVFGESGQKRLVLLPEKTDVALFNPEHKHIRDRIHAGHQFRPPSEFPMPLQSFFECRTASQWTWTEDDELKSLVREFSYNWSLISNMLSSRSLFSSGAERRTPWECFERWIHLEGLPADMQKTHYFRAYNSRIEAANRNVMAQQAPQPANNAQGQVQQQRRRTTTSVRVERRRNQKHLTLVDAMRKLAKKRETNLQKQQHAASLAAMRKAQEVPQARGPLKTPQQLSKIKYEHEQRLKESQIVYQQRIEAQRKAAMQARVAGQNPQGLPNGAQQRPTGPNGLPPNGVPSPASQNLTVPGQGQNQARRPMPPQMQGQLPMQNNLRPPQGLMNGMPQAQMQNMQGQLPLPNPALDVGLVTQANRIAEQQRQAIQMRPQGQMAGPGQVYNSPPRNMHGMAAPGFPQMQNGMMPFAGNNLSSPGNNPSTQGQAGSPRMGHVPQLTSGMVPQAVRLEESIRQKYPNASQEQVMRMISETLAKSVHQRQGLVQSAMNAAAGGNINGMPNGMANGMASSMGMNGMGGNTRMPGGVESSPQLYAQMLRQQQEKQAQAAQAAQQAQQAAATQSTANGQSQQQIHQSGK